MLTALYKPLGGNTKHQTSNHGKIQAYIHRNVYPDLVSPPCLIRQVEDERDWRTTGHVTASFCDDGVQRELNVGSWLNRAFATAWILGGSGDSFGNRETASAEANNDRRTTDHVTESFCDVGVQRELNVGEWLNRAFVTG
ncbi:hypothetical protein WN48_00770 [Eufriesea mexicana]|uniref:Uncharacterized protein n=1 Tax=Eufriesea mexicana TaxID=516756 RepID=A0A310S589_9HYME|nr:hypothetical protein WN48_00770 [Eufriesea mexicana]